MSIRHDEEGVTVLVDEAGEAAPTAARKTKKAPVKKAKAGKAAKAAKAKPEKATKKAGAKKAKPEKAKPARGGRSKLQLTGEFEKIEIDKAFTRVIGKVQRLRKLASPNDALTLLLHMAVARFNALHNYDEKKKAA